VLDSQHLRCGPDRRRPGELTPSDQSDLACSAPRAEQGDRNSSGDDSRRETRDNAGSHGRRRRPPIPIDATIRPARLLRIRSGTRPCWSGFILCFVVLLLVQDASAAASATTSAPTISLSPSTNLIDGQVVTVSGSDFSPSQLDLTECVTPDANECGLDTTTVSVAPTGTFSARYSVTRMLIFETNRGVDSVDCAVASCVLRAQEYHTGQSVESPLAFNAGAPPLVKIGIDPTAQLNSTSAAVTVTGTISCRKTMDVDLTGTITQTQRPLLYQQRLFADPLHLQQVQCTRAPTSWSTRVSPWPGRQAAGGAAGNFAVGNTTVVVQATPAALTQPLSLRTARVLIHGGASGRHIYYLALGESLAHGYAAAPGLGYTNDLLAYLRKKIPGLQLVELSCNDETTSQAISGGDYCNYGTSASGAELSQLQAAEAFLKAHRNSVALITMDLGGVDLIRCSTAACVAQVEPTLAANLTTIVKGLHQAGGKVPIVADNFFDPVLSDWFQGSSRRAYATASVPGIKAFNAFLVATYAGLGVQSADIQGAFKTADMTPVSSKWGTIPRDVYMMCRYTDTPCPQPLLDVDANQAGYRIFAKAFEKVVGPLLFPRLHRRVSQTQASERAHPASEPKAEVVDGVPLIPTSMGQRADCRTFADELKSPVPCPGLLPDPIPVTPTTAATLCPRDYGAFAEGSCGPAAIDVTKKLFEISQSNFQVPPRYVGVSYEQYNGAIVPDTSISGGPLGHFVFMSGTEMRQVMTNGRGGGAPVPSYCSPLDVSSTIRVHGLTAKLYQCGTASNPLAETQIIEGHTVLVWSDRGITAEVSFHGHSQVNVDLDTAVANATFLVPPRGQ
jgi:lysophospholipase L1-like esterase